MEVSFTKQELDSIIKELKHMTRREAIRLVFKDEKPAHLYSSKLGGLPYYGGQLVYPFNSEGEPMPLLLQLNLEELNIPCALPEKGLLQFFVSVFPMECKVIYQKDIDRSLDTVRPIPKAIPVFSEFCL